MNWNSSIDKVKFRSVIEVAVTPIVAPAFLEVGCSEFAAKCFPRQVQHALRPSVDSHYEKSEIVKESKFNC